METINIIHATLPGLCVSAALYLGRLLTETRFRLADKHPFFNRKPFSCRPCLTFHLGWMLSGAAALVCGSPFLLVSGAVASFLVWIVLETENRSKTDL